MEHKKSSSRCAAIIAAIALAGCSYLTSLSPEDRLAARELVAAEADRSGLVNEFDIARLWKSMPDNEASPFACAVDEGIGDREQLRAIIDLQRESAIIEPSRSAARTADIMLLAQTRLSFQTTWADVCEPYDPDGSWLVGLFS